MRVCMLAYTHYEMDNRVRRYAETLAARGDEVDVIVYRPEGESWRRCVKGVRVFRIQRRIAKEKSKLPYVLKMGGFLLLSGAFLTIKAVRKRYDLIHVHSVPDIEVFAALIPRLTGAKIILDIHDIMPEFYLSKFTSTKGSWLYRLLLLLERVSIRFADHVIVANDIWRKTLVSRSVQSNKCTAMLNYPDTTIFRRLPRQRKDGRMIMIYPGSVNYHQGLDLAIRAFGRIRDQIKEAEFHIYGSGGELDNLIKLSRDLNLSDRVLFKTTVPMEEIAKIMSEADLGVVPKRAGSFGNEAFSTKILEFMAVGVPVIVSDSKVDKLYFNDSLVTFFRSDDEADLAEKMVRLLTDRQERCRKAESGMEFIQSNNWEVKKDIYLDLVDSLSGKRGTTEQGVRRVG